ncbi:MAG: hypothetical protein EP335_17455 [Alphaproteobacteria bacterium]|nr:MAG: hypothetical protein EP335_17455 [Alphaproteobacteria bacterium]
MNSRIANTCLPLIALGLVGQLGLEVYDRVHSAYAERGLTEWLTSLAEQRTQIESGSSVSVDGEVIVDGITADGKGWQSTRLVNVATSMPDVARCEDALAMQQANIDAIKKKVDLFAETRLAMDLPGPEAAAKKLQWEKEDMALHRNARLEWIGAQRVLDQMRIQCKPEADAG